MIQNTFIFSLISLFLLFTPLVISTKAEVKGDPDDDWLHVNDKAQIVDSSSKEVWSIGINWFGFSTLSQVFDGV